MEANTGLILRTLCSSCMRREGHLRVKRVKESAEERVQVNANTSLQII